MIRDHNDHDKVIQNMKPYSIPKGHDVLLSSSNVTEEVTH